MENKAVLVNVSLKTRVITKVGMSDEEILNLVKDSFLAKIEYELMENLESIVDDTECPYGSLDGDIDEIVDVIYVSVWDGGCEVFSRCKYNKTTKTVFDIDSVEVDDVDILDEEFIRIGDEKINNFYDSDNDRYILDGENTEITESDIERFLSEICTKVRVGETSAYTELMMDDHRCIRYKGVEYYVPRNSDNDIVYKLLTTIYPLA